MNPVHYLVVGAGFSGAVLARELAEKSGASILVVDERDHIGGNCRTERDADTGVMVHHYGPHIFNTDNDRVWEYVNQFGDFRPFVNRVKASTSRGMFSMPINLLTINQFFGKTMGPDEARHFVASLGDSSIEEPQNFEEQALKMLGRDLYEAFFKGYTIKQWGCDPRDLPASVLKRLPIRFNYDDNYYAKKHQGIPAEGYSEVIRRILDHPNIEVRLNTAFDPATGQTVENGKSQNAEKLKSEPQFSSSPHSSFSASQYLSVSDFHHIFYTGPIDAFFGYSEGRLGYRTVTFERISTDTSDYQGNAVINYPGMDVDFTRIHEHKHFTPWEQHEKTVAFREFSKETGPTDIPYYPKRLAADKTILQKYRALAESLSENPTSDSLPVENRESAAELGETDSRRLPEGLSQAKSISVQQSAINSRPQVARRGERSKINQQFHTNGVSFLGRLATYRYMDMEAVIGEALEFSDSFLAATRSNQPPSIFPNSEV